MIYESNKKNNNMELTNKNNFFPVLLANTIT